MRIGIVVGSLAPLTAAGAESVLEGAGLEVERVGQPVAWAATVESGSVLVAGCASRSDCDLFLRIREASPHVPTVALTTSPSLSPPLLRCGAWVVLPSATSVSWLLVAVEAIGAGLSVVPHLAFHDWTPTGGKAQDTGHVTDQEIDWLRILASGVTIGRLADTVGYSERNMQRLLAATYRKLDVSTRTEALLEATRRGLLD